MAASRKTAVGATPDFETAMSELESIIQQMESSQLPLEAALQAYERGVALIKACQARLDTVQAQVSVLEGDLLKPIAAVAGITDDAAGS